MQNLFVLAAKLHDVCCPRCNGRCFCGGYCGFSHSATTEDDWKNNGANNYFLELARKGETIIKEAGLNEDDFIAYAKAAAERRTSDIPENVRQLMETHNFN